MAELAAFFIFNWSLLPILGKRTSFVFPFRLLLLVAESLAPWAPALVFVVVVVVWWFSRSEFALVELVGVPLE